jgi:hypothetical protein
MSGKCANLGCSETGSSLHPGKLFRLDIDLGNAAGECQRKTVYVWLCSRCAQQLRPKVQVAGDTVRVHLSKIDYLVPPKNPAFPAGVN